MEIGDNMPSVDIKVDDNELKRIYKALKGHKEEAKKAVVSALNRTVQSANTELQKNITANYNIKKKDLNGGNAYKGESSNNIIKVKKASTANLSASINVRGSSLTLYRFVRGNKQPRNKKGKGYVSVQVKKGATKKMSRVNFIQYGKGGALQIFQRHSRSRDISRALKTLSVAQMASNKDVMKNTQEKANEMLRKRVDHEIEHRLSKLRS